MLPWVLKRRSPQRHEKAERSTLTACTCELNWWMVSIQLSKEASSWLRWSATPWQRINFPSFGSDLKEAVISFPFLFELPVCKLGDEQLEEGGFQNLVAVVLIKIGVAGDLFCPLTDHFQGKEQCVMDRTGLLKAGPAVRNLDVQHRVILKTEIRKYVAKRILGIP